MKGEASMSLRDEVMEMLQAIDLESPVARQHGLTGARTIPTDPIEFANHLAAQTKMLATICVRLAEAIDTLAGDGNHPHGDG